MTAQLLSDNDVNGSDSDECGECSDASRPLSRRCALVQSIPALVASPDFYLSPGFYGDGDDVATRYPEDD